MGTDPSGVGDAREGDCVPSYRKSPRASSSPNNGGPDENRPGISKRNLTATTVAHAPHHFRARKSHLDQAERVRPAYWDTGPVLVRRYQRGR